MSLSHRDIKSEESEAIADYLNGMLGCNLCGMYPESLTHKSMSNSAFTRSVKKCVVFTEHKPDCNIAIPKACKPRNTNDKLANMCHQKVAAAHQCYMGKNSSHCNDPELQPYIRRLNCYSPLEENSRCLRKFESQCKAKRMSVTKINRMSMQSVEAIIQKIPDIYIVFYVRDPRGIFVSRAHSPSFYVDIDVLCTQMEKDYHIYTELKAKFPKSLHMMRYEDLAIHQEDAIHELFRFVEEPITDVTWKFMARVTNATHDSGGQGVVRADSVKTATAWRDKIDADTYKISKKKCGILKLLGYDL